MTGQQAFIFTLLAATLLMFAWGRWRYDMVAVAAMVAVVLVGVVPADEALRSFGHPAVVTVAAVLVISRALRNSGIVDLIAQQTYSVYCRHSIGHNRCTLTGVVTVASGFMNNVGALALNAAGGAGHCGQAATVRPRYSSCRWLLVRSWAA